MSQANLRPFLKAATTCNKNKCNNNEVKLKGISVPSKLQLQKYLSLVSYPRVQRDLQQHLRGTGSA